MTQLGHDLCLSLCVLLFFDTLCQALCVAYFATFTYPVVNCESPITRFHCMVPLYGSAMWFHCMVPQCTAHFYHMHPSRSSGTSKFATRFATDLVSRFRRSHGVRDESRRTPLSSVPGVRHHHLSETLQNSELVVPMIPLCGRLHAHPRDSRDAAPNIVLQQRATLVGNCRRK